MKSPRNPHDMLTVLAELELLRDGKADERKRQFRRFVVRGEAELHPVDRTRLDHPPTPIQLRDAGWGGVGFVCQESLAANSMRTMCFTTHGYVIGCETVLVRHCRKIEEGLYLVGGQFCVRAGILSTLGIEAAALQQSGLTGGSSEDSGASFVAPGDVR
jgi:hypothetical protein